MQREASSKESVAFLANFGMAALCHASTISSQVSLPFSLV